MNAGVRLVHSYLVLNGFFTITELPVLRQLRRGEYDQVTDLDLLGVRFARAEYVVPRGRPGPADDLRLASDELWHDTPADVDVIIAEVKEGKPRLNDALRRPEALETALRRVGCIPEAQMAASIERLRHHGEVRLDAGQPDCLDVRVQLVAFGDGPQGQRSGYRVISLQHVAAFVERHLERYHDVLQPADLGDTPLGLLHLLRKLR